MTIPLKSTVGRVKKGSTIYAVKNIALNYEAVAEESLHSGLLMPTNVRVAGAQIPTVSFQMYFADAYAAWGLSLTATPTTEFYFANIIGAIIDSNSTHQKVGINTSCLMCTHIERWGVSEGGEWLADCRSYFFSNDGDADPALLTGSLALPSLTAIPVIHGIGVFTPSAVDLPGMIGHSYQAGLSLNFQRTDAQRYVTGAAPSGFKPMIRVEHADPLGLVAILGSEGAEISGSTTITGLKYLPSGKLTATGKKTLTVASGQGFIRPVAASVEHGQLFRGGCEILLASTDGITHPIGVS